jgi:two-component system, chemotaxis family, protein-glutamate methylesterase/glutaminase
MLENSLEKKIKVVVADDSALMRKLIPELLKRDSEIDVVATAMDGLGALKKIEQHKPDVITLDIMMPNMDGMTALRHIVSQFNIPVIIISALTQRGASVTLEALEAGAIDFIAKPQIAIPEKLSEMAGELIAKVKAVARRPVYLFQERGPVEHLPIKTGTSDIVAGRSDIDGAIAARSLICIGISTGGPDALSFLIPRLPKSLAAGVMIVQHMPEGFTAQLAQRLNSRSDIEVKEAEDGDLVLPGRVLLARGGRHLRVKKREFAVIAEVSEGPPVSGHCPSVDLLFASAASEYGSKAIGLIMTGMGDDGVSGLGEIKEAGGLTLAQDEASSVIFGMPKVALARGYASRALALEQIPSYLTEKVGLL